MLQLHVAAPAICGKNYITKYFVIQTQRQCKGLQHEIHTNRCEVSETEVFKMEIIRFGLNPIQTVSTSG